VRAQHVQDYAYTPHPTLPRKGGRDARTLALLQDITHSGNPGATIGAAFSESWVATG
jgi:hypothetical protein